MGRNPPGKLPMPCPQKCKRQISMVFIFMVSVTLKIRVGVKKSYEICCVPSLLRT